MRLTEYFVVAICLLQCVAAEGVVINEVLYNPLGSDTGMEFVELHNPTNEMISLNGYILESGNGANPNDWTVEWIGLSSDMILPNGYFLIGESNVSPTPDYLTNLDLQNSPDGVRLKTNITLIDTVGYGNLQFPEYYEGTPAKNVAEGLSLTRTSGIDTNNNSADFTASQPNPQSGKNLQSGLSVRLVVMEPGIDIASISLLDEYPDTAGIQIVPLAGMSKDVNISVRIQDSQGLETNTTAKVTVNAKDFNLQRRAYNSTTQDFSGTFRMSFSDAPGNYTVLVRVTSGGKVGTAQASFEYMPLTAIAVDASSLNISAQPNTLLQVIGDLDMRTKDKATVRNIGNVGIDIGVKGSQLLSDRSSIDSANLELAFGQSFSQAVALSTSLQYIPLGLQSDNVKELSYRIFVPQNALPGVYKGLVSITARSSG